MITESELDLAIYRVLRKASNKFSYQDASKYVATEIASGELAAAQTPQILAWLLLKVGGHEENLEELRASIK